MSGNVEATYDIFDWFPIGVCQNIFSYLRGRDIIAASTVNKEWNKLAAESQQMSKLKLVFSEVNQHMLTDEVVQNMKNSTRKHQNIEFREVSFTDLRHYMTILEDRAGSWKSVNLNRCPRLDDTLFEIFRVIEPSVEELKMTRHATMGYETADPIEWTFPCLKALESDFGPFTKYFVRCRTLVKLDFISYMDNTKAIRTLLHNNHDLKDLSCTADSSLFEHPFEFQLKTLAIKKNYFAMFNFRRDNFPQTIHSFLETQAQTLESLELDEALRKSLLVLILRDMPRLTSLTMKIKDASCYQPLPVNTTITTLDLQDQIVPDGTSHETFIRSLTGLKNFKILEINEKLLNFLAREVPALESIETRLFNVPLLPERDIFPNVKELNVGAFHEDMQEPTGDGNFAALVRKEMRG